MECTVSYEMDFSQALHKVFCELPQPAALVLIGPDGIAKNVCWQEIQAYAESILTDVSLFLVDNIQRAEGIVNMGQIDRTYAFDLQGSLSKIHAARHTVVESLRKLGVATVVGVHITDEVARKSSPIKSDTAGRIARGVAMTLNADPPTPGGLDFLITV